MIMKRFWSVRLPGGSDPPAGLQGLGVGVGVGVQDRWRRPSRLPTDAFLQRWIMCQRLLALQSPLRHRNLLLGHKLPAHAGALGLREGFRLGQSGREHRLRSDGFVLFHHFSDTVTVDLLRLSPRL